MATYNSINDYINSEVRGNTSLVPAQGTAVTTFEPSKEFMDLVKATILQARASMNNNSTSGLDELNKNLEEIRELLKSIVSASAEMKAKMQKNLDNIEIPLLESESARKRMELDKAASTSLTVIEERLNKIIEYYDASQKRETENKDKNAIESERKAARRNVLLDKFFTWASDLLGTIKDFAKQLEELGATIADSFTKKVNILITKDIDSTSSKIQKAKESGCQILSIDKAKEIFK